MKFTYIGPYDEVEIPSAGVVCKRGESVDVPDSLRLQDQPSNWEPVKPTVTKKEN